MHNLPPSSHKHEKSTEQRSISRRGFIKLGAATVAAGVALTYVTSPTETIKNTQLGSLSPQAAEFLGALVPVVVGTSLPSDAKAEAAAVTSILEDVDNTIHSLNDFAQQQVHLLFDLLSIAPTRVLLGGPWTAWRNASPEQINNFLIGLHSSFFQHKRMCYEALTNLITQSWYAQPKNFYITGYPGPPNKIPTLPITDNFKGKTDVQT